MIRYIFRRTLIVIPVLLGVLIIVFSLSTLMPGDPVRSKLGNDYTQEQYDALKHEMGLDKGYFERLFSYIRGIITKGDLGTSYDTGKSVSKAIGERIWTTVRLGVLSICFVALVGIPVGIYSAIKRNTIQDYSITTFSIILASVPNFVMALLGMLLFALTLRWLPAGGLKSWKHYILPVVCNGMTMVAAIIRMTRSSMLEVIRQDYIRTARAKGLSERTIIFKHALKNALIPVITTLGGMLGAMVGGTIIIETIFNIPGMGMLLVGATNSRDYPMIMGIALLICIFVCVMNLLVDIAYAIVDPRIKSQFAARKRMKTKSAKGGRG